MPSAKLEALLSTYDQLSASFKDINSPQLRELTDSWSKSLAQLRDLLSQTQTKVNRAVIIAGLEQGLRETPLLLSVLDNEKRQEAVRKFQHVVSACLGDFFEKDAKALEKIVKSGKLTNDRQWSLVRNRIDIVEGQAGYQSELSFLYHLLEEYEANPRKQK